MFLVSSAQIPADSLTATLVGHGHLLVVLVEASVVSPEISSGKFPEIYSYFSGNSQ